MTLTALKPVESKAMVAHGYDLVHKTLAIQFHSGNVVHYRDVPHDVAQGLAEAESAGRYFSAHIRGKFQHAVVTDPATQEASHAEHH